MSFSLSGTLNVIERNGRNGPFTVAELNTDVGVFKIKHRVLEQFDQGAYSGVFIITRIYNQSNFSKGQIWVSLCADLDWDALQIMAQSEQVHVSTSMAVAEIVGEDEEAHPTTAVADLAKPTANTVPQIDDDEAVADMATLQCLLADHAAYIKLDASIEDRTLFRQLRDALKERGYRFDGNSQSWFLPEAA
jgi:hypothetical protein